MQRKEVIERLTPIFCDVFDDGELKITEVSSPDEIDDWDSLAQINLVALIEPEFGVKFDMDDLLKIRSAGDIVDIIFGKV